MTASLVIAPQWIGDAVMSEPLMRRLAARGERLSVGALPWVAPIYRAMRSVDEVIDLPFQHGGLQWSARRAMARQLHGQFDKAYVCPNSLKSALLPWWAGIPVRIGYHGESRYGLLNQRLPQPAKGSRTSMVAHYLALATEPAPLTSAASKPQLDLPLAQLKTVLAAQNLSAGRHVVIAPGAEYGPAKRWPLSHFAQLADRLDLPVVLLGSAKEAAWCDDILAQMSPPRRQHSRNLAGQTTLGEAMALIASAHSVVSNDSGLMHVAAAFGVPQVALFGSSSPAHTPPLNDKAQVLWLKNQPQYQPALDCAPCFERVCPLGHTRCLNDLRPEAVEQAWREVVSG
jgi:heptosyltransferase-2